MAAGSLGYSDPLALEISKLPDRRIAMRQDRLSRRRRRLPSNVDQAGACRLGEHRYGIGHICGDIDVTDVQRFQQRQTAGELMPGHLHPLFGQHPFKRALAAQQSNQGRGLLKTDSHCGVSGYQATDQEAADGTQRRQKGVPAEILEYFFHWLLTATWKKIRLVAEPDRNKRG